MGIRVKETMKDAIVLGGLVVACCTEDGRFRVRSRAGSEQDFKLYSLLSGVSTAHIRGWRGVVSCKEIKMGDMFP